MRKIGWIGHHCVAHRQREQADRDVEVKYPPPAVVIGDVAAECRADDRRQERGDAENRLRGALLFDGERIEQDALARGLQAAAGQALQHAGGDQHVEAGGHAAQGGGQREHGDRQQEVIAAAQPHGQPAGNRQHDGVRGQVTSDDPFAIGGRGREAARHVAQRDVGDRRVEHFHEGRNHDRRRHQPGRNAGPAEGRRERPIERGGTHGWPSALAACCVAPPGFTLSDCGAFGCGPFARGAALAAVASQSCRY